MRNGLMKFNPNFNQIVSRNQNNQFNEFNYSSKNPNTVNNIAVGKIGI